MTLEDLKRDGRPIDAKIHDYALAVELSDETYSKRERDAAIVLLERARDYDAQGGDATPLLHAVEFFIDEEKLVFGPGDGAGFLDYSTTARVIRCWEIRSGRAHAPIQHTWARPND
jgi:hypothetical protein